MQINKKFLRIFAVVALVAFLAVAIISMLPPINSGAITSQEAKRKKEEAQGKQSAEIERREKLDTQISGVQAQIDSYQSQIDEKIKQIEESQSEIDKLTKDLQNQNASYIERAKTTIKRGNVSNVEILLKSKSPEDFLNRTSVLKYAAKYDSEKMDEISASMEEVEKLKKELITQKEAVVKLKTQQDAEKVKLDGYREESQQIIDNLQKDIEEFERQYEAAKKAEEAARNAAYAASTSGNYSVPANFVGGQFMWPSNTTLVTSPYGYRIHPVTKRQRFHSGVDIGAPYGSSIYAANSGTVVVSGYNTGGYGNYVVISHGGGYSTLYAHCSSLSVSAGQQVSKGQVIAKCGSTGMSTGPHIHFEIQQNGKTTNPMAYFG